MGKINTTTMRKINVTIRCFFLLLCSVSVLFSCASRKGIIGFSNAPLFGMVYDYENQPCPEAQISIDGMRRAATDINGRFVIQRLSRGKHRVSVAKEGYESLSFVFEFLNRSQVLYMKMFSFDQLIKMAEEALEKEKWGQGETFIERAESIDKNDPVLRYLKAVVIKQKGEPEKAVSVLLDVIKDGYGLPYIYLTLADLYQYSLNKPSEALRYIEEYLKVKGDKEAQKRLDQLKQELAQETRETDPSPHGE